MLVKSLVTANISAAFPYSLREDPSQSVLWTLKSLNTITWNVAWFETIVSIVWEKSSLKGAAIDKSNEFGSSVVDLFDSMRRNLMQGGHGGGKHRLHYDDERKCWRHNLEKLGDWRSFTMSFSISMILLMNTPHPNFLLEKCFMSGNSLYTWKHNRHCF